MFQTTKELMEFMTRPSPRLIDDVKRIQGDIMILGAGGKVGPALAIKAKRAVDAAGTGARVIAVSLFDYPDAPAEMRSAGVEVIEADLSNPGQLRALPDVENIIYMVGKKFGTAGNQSLTWYINVVIPTLVCQRFPKASIVSFSTGNYYGAAPIRQGGFCEEDIPAPIGEYAQSCMARERVMEHFSRINGTKMLQFRLNYAIDLRYGVLYDIARAIMEGKPVDLTPAVFNCVWQGDVCEYAIRSLLLTESPSAALNVSSPEAISIRWAAGEIAKRLGKDVTFTGTEGETALFSNCQKMVRLLGRPLMDVPQMMDLVCAWVLQGGEVISAPTHFEATDGVF